MVPVLTKCQGDGAKIEGPWLRLEGCKLETGLCFQEPTNPAIKEGMPGVGNAGEYHKERARDGKSRWDSIQRVWRMASKTHDPPLNAWFMNPARLGGGGERHRKRSSRVPGHRGTADEVCCKHNAGNDLLLTMKHKQCNVNDPEIEVSEKGSEASAAARRLRSTRWPSESRHVVQGTHRSQRIVMQCQASFANDAKVECQRTSNGAPVPLSDPAAELVLGHRREGVAPKGV